MLDRSVDPPDSTINDWGQIKLDSVNARLSSVPDGQHSASKDQVRRGLVYTSLNRLLLFFGAHQAGIKHCEAEHRGDYYKGNENNGRLDSRHAALIPGYRGNIVQLSG